jgi:outer membrane protein assembly factor BamE (lipoprotein component of BamABCDE complex)
MLTTLLLFGCATAHKMNSVQLGMTKSQVIEVLGRPDSISAQGSTEVFRYHLYETSDDAYNGFDSEYFVRLINGNVDSYGRMGDFDSTKD